MSAPTGQTNPAPTSALLSALRNHYLKPGEPIPGGVPLTEAPAPDAARRAIDQLDTAVHAATHQLATPTPKEPHR